MAVQRFTIAQTTTTASLTNSSQMTPQPASYSGAIAQASGAKLIISFPFSVTATSGNTPIVSTIQVQLRAQVSGSTYTQIYNQTIRFDASSGTFSATTTISGAIYASAGLQLYIYANVAPRSSGQRVTLTLGAGYFILGSATAVKAGDPIKKTDFDNVSQSATVGSAISNGNFAGGTAISASAWNSYWGLS